MRHRHFHDTFFRSNVAWKPSSWDFMRHKMVEKWPCILKEVPARPLTYLSALRPAFPWALQERCCEQPEHPRRSGFCPLPCRSVRRPYSFCLPAPACLCKYQRVWFCSGQTILFICTDKISFRWAFSWSFLQNQRRWQVCGQQWWCE